MRYCLYLGNGWCLNEYYILWKRIGLINNNVYINYVYLKKIWLGVLWLFMSFCFYYWKRCGGWSWGLDGVCVGIWVCNS